MTPLPSITPDWTRTQTPMGELPPILQEAGRLAALSQLQVMDTGPESLFDTVTRLAARIVGVPLTLVSLVDDHRQFFKSKFGSLPEPWETERETPLSHSFCQHVVADRRPLVLADARLDPALAGNLAIRDLAVVAYLGVPLAAPGGEILGSFCAIDSRPRNWTAGDVEAMSDLASLAEHLLEMRMRERVAEDRRAKLEVLLAQVREADALRRSHFEHSADAMLIITPDGRILAANTAAAELFGYSVDELRAGGRMQIVDAADPRLFDLLRRRERDGYARGELTLRRGSGATFQAELVSSVYRDAGGELQISMVIRDITDRVKLDESLQATLNALEQKVRSEQLMLSVISHEFRTPLSTIQGFSEMLRDETALPADKVREFAGDINEEAKRLTRLVNALLERSRLESGRIQLDLTEFDVGAAVEAVVRQMGTASERHQLKITTVRGGQMYADRDRVTQCVMNLVSNAIKYSPDGGVVDILVDGDDATACVSVRDDGIGISPADQVVIFEPYHRLTESVAEGTGLGLSITRQLVELHGGRISVDSALGKGSTFRMCLPRGGPPKVVVGASR